MFRTIKVSLPKEDSLLQTATAFNKACQIVLNYGLQFKTYNKHKLNKETYKNIRKSIPNLPAALVQTARDQASELIKSNNSNKITKKKLSIRYDKRTFKFYPESDYVSLSTIHGRLNFPFKHYPYMDKWKGEYTNAQLTIQGNRIFLNIQVKLPNPELITMKNKVLGIDRGIINTAVCSDNTFYNSKQLRNIKGRYQYNRRILQSVGTRSAKRKLRKLSGRERRFARSVNHDISKKIIAKPYNIIALEELTIGRNKKRGRLFNRKLNSWSFYELQGFLEYKAQESGKITILIDPKHTSQCCSRCGYIHEDNRHGSLFKCLNCGFELNADLNASRNIEIIGKSNYLRLCANQPIVAPDETGVDGSYKSPLLGRDS